MQRDSWFKFICIGNKWTYLTSLAYFLKSEYQRPVESLFLELPLTSAFIQLSACCCWNNAVWNVQSGMCLCQFQVALCWFHQLNQVQLWLRLTGHMSNVNVSQSSTYFPELLFNLLLFIQEKFANPLCCFHCPDFSSTHSCLGAALGHYRDVKSKSGSNKPCLPILW